MYENIQNHKCIYPLENSEGLSNMNEVMNQLLNQFLFTSNYFISLFL